MKLKTARNNSISAYEHDVELEARLDAYLRKMAHDDYEEERMVRRRDHWING